MVSVIRRVAAISEGPRSASPRGRRARSFWGFFGFSAMGGVGTSAGATRQPGLLLPLRSLRGRVGVGATRGPVLVAFPHPGPPPHAGEGAVKARRGAYAAAALPFGCTSAV